MFPISRITHCLSVSASLSEHHVLKVHPCWRECQGFSRLMNLTVYGGTTFFVSVHELVDGHFGGLHFGVVGVQVFV